MKKFIKDNVIQYANRIVVTIDGVSYINPTEEQILSAGWIEYIEPTPEPPAPRSEPNPFEIERAITLAMETQAKQAFLLLDDQEALKVKELADTWASKIGQQVNVGDRLWYDGKLYKVRMQHTVQEDWYPSVGTASMFEEIVQEHAGTKDDPIPYNIDYNSQFAGMTLELGKFYTQGGIIYECIEETGIPVYAELKDLARYVKVAE